VTTDGKLANLAARCSAAAVAAGFPFTGLGPTVRHRLDEQAALAVQRELKASPLLPALALAGCEGARDGAVVVDFPSAPQADAYLYCDPIDGTLNAARGGPRSFSVTAFGRHRPQPWINALDDSTAVFGIGSNSDDVSSAFAAEGRWHTLLRDSVTDPSRLTATLNRADNLTLLLDLGGLALTDFTVGSRAGYRPTLRGPGCVAVGDATATLPFECDLEFGRIGLTEAQVQSGLYRSWTGLIVSRKQITGWPAGPARYLSDYLAARLAGDPRRLAGLFTADELARFADAGSDLLTVTSPLTQAAFGIGTDGIAAIAALSSDLDPWLEDAGRLLENPRWRPGESVLAVDALVVAGGSASHRTVTADPLRDRGLPAPLRHWYQTFDWAAVAERGVADAPWLAGFGAIASGSDAAPSVSGGLP
jgi:hypothetical protein